MTRTFIYGSCVSRDTFEILRTAEFELVSYIARQSLASAMSAPNSATIPSFAATSHFQRRMLVADWEGSLLRTIRRSRGEIDLLLWDVFDERLGFNRLPTGGIVTRSVDSLSTGLEDALPPASAHVPLGSPAHRACFTALLPKFRAELEDLGLFDRTLLVAPPWATTSVDGHRAPSSYALKPDRANELYRAYYQEIDTILGLPYVSLHQAEALADPDHRWGPAPFHYSRQAYEHLAAQIKQFADGLPPRHY